jgi:hypothetical protein
MSGVMSGDRASTYACQLEVTSSQWQSRRFITFVSWIRDGAAIFSMASAFEMTPKGPVQVTNMCQGSPTASTGPTKARRLSPKGWSTMPDDLKVRLCPK